MRIPVWEAVRLTLRAISPRLAIRMDRRGSVAGDPELVVVFVLACRMARLGWRTAVVPRRARSLEGVDIVDLGGEQWHARQATWPARVPMLTDYMDRYMDRFIGVFR
jgi:hypothetical protein